MKLQPNKEKIAAILDVISQKIKERGASRNLTERETFDILFLADVLHFNGNKCPISFDNYIADIEGPTPEFTKKFIKDMDLVEINWGNLSVSNIKFLEKVVGMHFQYTDSFSSLNNIVKQHHAYQYALIREDTKFIEPRHMLSAVLYNEKQHAEIMHNVSLMNRG